MYREPDHMAEAILVDKQVKQWLEKNTECPTDIKEWLTREYMAVGKPIVIPRDKLRYIQSHSFVKSLYKELSRPMKITPASDLNEAMKIAVEDHVKVQQGRAFHLSMEEWNKAWDAKDIEVITEREQGFLMYGQQFKGTVMYKGKKYRVCAWSTPTNDNYVDFEEIEAPTIEAEKPTPKLPEETQ